MDSTYKLRVTFVIPLYIKEFILPKYYRYLIVKRFFRIKDPKAKNMGIIFLVNISIGITQFALGVIAVIGNPILGRILVSILIVEFLFRFFFIYRQCGSLIYSTVINIPGLSTVLSGWTWISIQLKNLS